MEEVLSNQEARPGDTTQLMHAIFSWLTRNFLGVTICSFL